MIHDENKTVTVASVKVTPRESVIISAFAKLAGTKVEAIASDLMKAFIKRHAKYELQNIPDEDDYNDVVDDYVDKEYNK